MLDLEKFEEFISQYPIYEYRLISTDEIATEQRVRTVCQEECERYGTTWACPPAVGSVEECSKKIHSFPYGIFFSSVAEVTDILNMDELLSTRKAHEKLCDEIEKHIKLQGYDAFALSTESCDICEKCTYLEGLPCRFPERMHPCLESYGVVASEIVEREKMEYQLGGNTVLWFSLVLFKGNKISADS